MTRIEHEHSRWAVPNYWQWAALGDLTEATSGETPRRDVPSNFNGGIPWLKSGELCDAIVYKSEETLSPAGLKASRGKVYPPGTVCIARSGTRAGRLGILELEAATNESICAIPPSKHLVPKYLFRFLELKRPALIAPNTSVTQIHISLAHLRTTLIPVPPIDEQNRIAAEIDSRLVCVDSLEKEIEGTLLRLRNYRMAILSAAFRGWLMEDEVPPVPGDSFVDLAANAQGGLDVTVPGGWIHSTFEQLCTQITSGWEIQNLYSAAGRPLVTARNISDGSIDFRGCGLISDDLFEGYKRRCVPEENDILIAAEGSNIGQAAIVGPYVDFAVGRNVMLLRPRIEPNFLLYWLRSPSCQTWFRKAAGPNGRGRLRLSKVRSMPIPHPRDPERQRIISDIECRFSYAHRLEAAAHRLQAHASTLKGDVLKLAFQGKLVQSGIHSEERTA